MIQLFRLTAAVFLLSVLSAAPCFGFSFSEYEKESAETASDQNPLSKITCSGALKHKKLAVLIGENHKDKGTQKKIRSYRVYGSHSLEDKFGTDKSVYGELVGNLNSGFRELGLKTYTPQQINEQIARQEQEAFLNNDLEAAMSAADRLKADFMLKGLISTLTQHNKVVKIDELFITISLSLTDRNGKLISSARVSETAFSDADIGATVQKMVEDQSRIIIYQLFNEYCQRGN